MIVVYGGRRIEVQLRTRPMHDWAITVEIMGGRLGLDLRGGDGPPELLRLLETASEAMALEEAGQPVDVALEDRLDRLRQEALPWLRG